MVPCWIFRKVFFLLDHWIFFLNLLWEFHLRLTVLTIGWQKWQQTRFICIHVHVNCENGKESESKNMFWKGLPDVEQLLGPDHPKRACADHLPHLLQQQVRLLIICWYYLLKKECERKSIFITESALVISFHPDGLGSTNQPCLNAKVYLKSWLFLLSGADVQQFL